ncbi:MAG TPA: 2-succinyl-6-hydroxy-2,4-cyclohexadiene-1-carboxylate synthase [Myxococcaceae bacterium]|nr:2-succinyl-6-hydroxy-2,4-cyclohexadiene-1-carboxylate synthase [Myxococcaceae bacterium]
MKLAFEQWGEGREPLLLLHGFTGNRTAWDHLRPLFSPRFDALAVDLPGHGESSPCERAGPAGFEQTLSALEGILDSLGARGVNLVGYSQGARLALALAFRAPGRIGRVVLESGSPGLRSERERAARRRSDEALACQIESVGTESFIERWGRRPLFQGLRRLPSELACALRARRLSCSAAGLASALRSLGAGAQPSYWEQLPRLRVPVLLLSGARDSKFSGIARQMARELPLAWAKSFQGAWHAPHLEAPAEYAQEVIGFLGATWFEPPSADQKVEAVT